MKRPPTPVSAVHRGVLRKLSGLTVGPHRPLAICGFHYLRRRVGRQVVRWVSPY